MDAEQLRIEEDLRGQIEGDVYCDDLFTQMYASDASIFELRPLAVARPRTREDVAALVRYASSRSLPIFARGAGTGLAGDSLGRGLVVDFSRYFRRILAVDDDSVVVQPGVVLGQLNERLLKIGRIFGPDPAAEQVTTMGSVIALDASGSHWPVYGSARSHVRELEVVLADGKIVRLARHALPEQSVTRDEQPTAYLAAGVHEITEHHRPAIEARATHSLVNRSGYHLHDLATPEGIDLARLIVGSEGTLALVTEAVLATSPLPKFTAVTLLFFTSIDNAAAAAVELSQRAVRACDLMDRRHLSLAREVDPRYELMIPAEAEAVLLVEREGDTAEAANDAIVEIETLIMVQRQLATGALTALDADDQDLMWQLARRFIPTLYRLRGNTRPVPFVEDIAVPPAALPTFLPRAFEALRKRQITASVFGHAAHGQLHIRPFIDLANAADVNNLRELAEELYTAVWEVGGTISGEHAEGYSRTPYVERQHGPLMGAFRDVKRLFDPQGLLNPGKKVPLEGTVPTAPLRRLEYPGTGRPDANGGPRGTVANGAAPSSAADDKPSARPVEAPLSVLEFAWSPDEMTHAARICNGCGACRTQSPDTRMCPTFRPSPREEASPRSKANLARALLTGGLPGAAVVDEQFKQILDLCIHCHMCRLECPANVDIPKLAAEAKAAYIASNGQSFHDWSAAHIDYLCSLAARAPRVANWAVGNRLARWLMEKTLGVAQGRKLPRFNKRPFLKSGTQRRLATAQRGAVDKVLLFVDTYANYCDDQLAKALVAVLEHNGVSVHVPDEQLDSGMPMIAQGVLGPARQIAEKNVGLLVEAVRQGYTVISTEPSAVLALKREYLHLLGDDRDAELVAENAQEACHYLWRRHQQGKLQLDFAPLDMVVGYHAPCHVKALEAGLPAVNLLGLIPGLRVRNVEKGCSGMAGMFGFQRKNYRNSLRIGLPLITELRSAGFQAGVSECSTCRVQMEQGSALPTIHPIKLLALAYRLMPELRALLNRPAESLIVG
jgi:FAD/FMN-containing dehydrogenase/Fe-S oxidoreductase